MIRLFDYTILMTVQRVITVTTWTVDGLAHTPARFDDGQSVTGISDNSRLPGFRTETNAQIT